MNADLERLVSSLPGNWPHDEQCAFLHGRAVGMKNPCDCGDCPVWDGLRACSKPYDHDGYHECHDGHEWPPVEILDPEPWESDGFGTRYYAVAYLGAAAGLRFKPRPGYVQDQQAYEWREER
jgi:hypothetical protein